MATVYETIRDLDFFQGVDEAALQAISGFTRKYRLPDQTWLLDHLPDAHNDLFILLEGEIEVFSRFINQNTGQPSRLGAITSGVFGELSWILNVERTARLKCLGSVKLVGIDGAGLHRYLAENPAAGYVVMKNILQVTANRYFHKDNLVQAMLRAEA